MQPYLNNIRKRDGRIVPFNQAKITDAINKALVATQAGLSELSRGEHAQGLSSAATLIIAKKFTPPDIPSVEGIQDIVEEVLIDKGFTKTAKAYILYRETHKKIRETQSTFVDVQKTMDEYLNQSDWRVKENSNTDYSFSGLMLHTAGKVIANYVLNEIYTPQVAETHRKGYIHIHDLGHGVVGYCSGWSLRNLLMQGFGNVPNKVDAKPAKHLSVVVHQMVNYIGCLQMEFAGAQAFSSVDTLLAPFVRADGLNYVEVKQNMQQLVFSLNIPSRWGCQMPFTNLTFDWTPPPDLKNEPAIVGGLPLDATYGEYREEMDMINRAFLEVMREGDANGRIFTFPIPTYNLMEDFDWDSENAELLFEVAAKYGTPYFQNYIGSDLDPRSIRALCCRLNLDTNELMKRPGGMWGPGESTGSIGVVTINLNRLGYEAADVGQFLDKVGHYMFIAKDSLEIKRRVIEKNMKNGFMPYALSYLGSFKNYFSTIGLCGMNEACLNLLGEDISTPAGKELAIKTLNYMRDQLREFQIETGNLYNLEATPAESTAYRLAKLDKEMYPDIMTSGEKEPYLTNSTHLPVTYTDDAILALEHQKDIQTLYTGGTIFHLFLGERMSSGESCKALVKKVAYNTPMPYFTITPTFSICRNHGYLRGEVERCGSCGEETEVYSRIVGYFRPINNWNAGKKEEFKDRLEYAEENTLKSQVPMIRPVRVVYEPEPAHREEIAAKPS